MNSKHPKRPPRPPAPPTSSRGDESTMEDEILSRRLSRDDLHELARMSSELVRRTLISGVDVFRDVSRELPKEASQYLNARKEQVLQTFSREFTESLINATMDRFFRMLREHRIDVSFRLVRDHPTEKAGLSPRNHSSVDSPLRESDKSAQKPDSNRHKESGRPEPSSGRDPLQGRSKVSYAEAVSAIAERLAKDVSTLRKSSKDK